MDWLRSAIGLTASFPDDREERNAKLINTRKLRLKQLQEALEQVDLELQNAFKYGRHTEARYKLYQKRQLETEVCSLKEKI